MNRTLWIFTPLALALGISLAAGTAWAQTPPHDPDSNDALDMGALESFSREPAPAREQAPAHQEEVDPEAASRRVRTNYQDTLETYENILERASRDTTPIDDRIASNQRLIDTYTPQLEEAQEQYSRLQVDFINRTLELRAQQESGDLSEEALERLIREEESRYRREREQLRADIDFFRQEIQAAQGRLGEFRTEREVVERRAQQDRERSERLGRPTQPPEVPLSQRVFGDVSGRLTRLDPFRPRRTLLGDERCPGCRVVEEPRGETPRFAEPIEVEE